MRHSSQASHPLNMVSNLPGYHPNSLGAPQNCVIDNAEKRRHRHLIDSVRWMRGITTQEFVDLASYDIGRARRGAGTGSEVIDYLYAPEKVSSHSSYQPSTRPRALCFLNFESGAASGRVIGSFRQSLQVVNIYER